ncbi:methyltransferase [Desulfoluna spongiiphila]|uniref:16S rRNA m(2)G 1207 methyltransferase n=1 Tax=Desulfoluna spongiiphila TaxID=419481 RepID=A0A1G5ACD6_9BACT|nr:methyltransferase [Desulfoluna spongiiphila]SCX75555.1 16S rRNA m(2)G 1207 methyltransferase [Desulfoluna spongiiphila]VVS90717.1 s-adenosyl-l-methionine-dependent methyltransferase [Desulfoluna spongiiphila]
MKKNRMNKRADLHEEHVSRFAREELPELPEATLVAEDERLASTLEADFWSRWSSGERPGQPWPSAGPFEVATLRLPKGRRAIEMAVHALGGSLAPEGELYIYGANDEGIKSVPKMFRDHFAEIDTVGYRQKCRLVRAKGPKNMKASLADWAQHDELLLDGCKLPWVTYPGLFAKGGVDEATALLLDGLEVHGNVLDFGCGTGVLTAGLLARGASNVDATDADALAVEATRINVPQAHTHLGDGWHALQKEGPWDMIVSNPPIHKGVSEDFGILQSLIREAPSRSKSLTLVVQRQVPVQRWLEESFRKVTRLKESPRFHVWQGKS